MSVLLTHLLVFVTRICASAAAAAAIYRRLLFLLLKCTWRDFITLICVISWSNAHVRCSQNPHQTYEQLESFYFAEKTKKKQTDRHTTVSSNKNFNPISCFGIEMLSV